MRNVFQLTLAIIAVTVAAPCVPSIAAAPKPVYKVLHESRVPVPMRDGVRLAAEVYRPDAPGRFPALMLLRYFREGNDRAPFFAQRGYAVALINCRGRYDSEGTWVPYCNEPRNGFDAQEWLVARPWCNGKIGELRHLLQRLHPAHARPTREPLSQVPGASGVSADELRPPLQRRRNAIERGFRVRPVHPARIGPSADPSGR